MKCIKDIKTDQITRVSDRVAEDKVRGGTAVYVNKQEWKDKVRDVKKDSGSKSNKKSKKAGKRKASK